MVFRQFEGFEGIQYVSTCTTQNAVRIASLAQSLKF